MNEKVFILISRCREMYGYLWTRKDSSKKQTKIGVLLCCKFETKNFDDDYIEIIRLIEWFSHTLLNIPHQNPKTDNQINSKKSNSNFIEKKNEKIKSNQFIDGVIYRHKQTKERIIITLSDYDEGVSLFFPLFISTLHLYIIIISLPLYPPCSPSHGLFSIYIGELYICCLVGFYLPFSTNKLNGIICFDDDVCFVVFFSKIFSSKILLLICYLY